MSAPISTACKGCGAEFPSKNSVFRHLNETGASCLSKADYQDFIQYAVQQKREKVIVLYGYWIAPPRDGDTMKGDNVKESFRNGDNVAQVLLEVMEQEAAGDVIATQQPVTVSAGKVNRSYGHLSRSDIVMQEDRTSAITEVLATKLPPIPGGNTAVKQWMRRVNDSLKMKLSSSKQVTDSEIRVLGRQPMPINKFNAEMDVSHRRVEYLLPIDFLMLGKEYFSRLPSFTDGVRSRNFRSRDKGEVEVSPVVVEDSTTHLLPYCQRPSNETLSLLTSYKKKMRSLTTHIVDLDTNDAAAVFEKQFHDQKRQRNRAYYNNSKTNKCEERQKDIKSNYDVVDGPNKKGDDVMEKSEMFVCSDERNKKELAPAKYHKKRSTGNKKQKEKVLKRKRYHNFTPTLMAHEFFTYRRLDRFYHRATLRFSGVSFNSVLKRYCDDSVKADATWEQEQLQRPFLALSLSGDMFLTGQACRVVGLFIALACGVIDDDFVDCVFDEKYSHLVPTPPAPTFAMYAGDVFYISIEGKAKSILTPRKTDRYLNGWNDEETVESVRDWEAVIREKTALAWLDKGVDRNGRLVAASEWTETVLKPWAEKARAQLDDYRLWKRAASTANVSDATQSETTTTATVAETSSELLVRIELPPLNRIDSTVPLAFEKVLYYLRKADASGLWPSTTPKRRLVMISNVTVDKTDNKSDGTVSSKPLTHSLSIAHMKAKSNKEARSSSYAFLEGQGGASGSFSLGAMPGDKCIQPKGNTLFPELMKAAFELELTLCPDREPSSTIAVNRNAQFRPHTDSGAGAGQSTSLIVGLGTYTGGELVVEGEKMDIRYKSVEFDGWKQRHWTMPFYGERYSLVWFTPKGCEGINFVR